MKCGSKGKQARSGYNIQGDIFMARHKKHERKKELDRKRHRRAKALKARVREAKAAAAK